MLIAILDDPRWNELPREFIGLKDVAHKQLGTSGGGNHFVEFCKLTVYADNPLDLEPGKYIALVSHSGSRGVGFKLANYYTQLWRSRYVPVCQKLCGAWLTSPTGQVQQPNTN